MIIMELIMSLLLLTAIVAVWIIGAYHVDEIIFRGHFVKKLRARFGIDQ